LFLLFADVHVVFCLEGEGVDLVFLLVDGFLQFEDGGFELELGEGAGFFGEVGGGFPGGGGVF
jgi:hypothetical protein